MNRNNADSYIPVLIKPSLYRPPCWGRLVRLWAEGAELISKFEIDQGVTVSLCFELGANNYEDIRALVTLKAKQTSGYFTYKLAMRNRAQIAALACEIAKSACQSSVSPAN